jgi:hypothetical protein
MANQNDHGDADVPEVSTEERKNSSTHHIANLPAYLFDFIERCLNLIDFMLIFIPENRVTKPLKPLVPFFILLSAVVLAAATVVLSTALLAFSVKLLGFVLTFHPSDMLAGLR